NDTEYEFRPGTEFAYLTGCYEHDAVLVITPEDEKLYLRPRAPRENTDFFLKAHGELWVGPRHTLSGYQTLYGITCADIAELPAVLNNLDAASTRVRRGLDASIDETLEGDKERDSELHTFLGEQRLIKDDWEIAQLVDAVDATVRGFEDIVRALPADRESPERLVDGVFGMRARHDGNWVGYQNIVAAGSHATTLHWWRNNGTCRPGELLLVDAGVENVHYYTADVTRTIPVSGQFSATQRLIYDIVYEAQEAGFAAVRPGATWESVSEACMRVLANGLESLGILPVPAADALSPENLTYKRWTLHSFGHMLGIDVHDCEGARREEYRGGVLKPGMVLTVEPGLYFQSDDELVPAQYRGIGIRIEDDVLVTEDGYVNLSAGLPRHADDVEGWMVNQRARGFSLPGEND
ncbi:MAG: aminopeptidase P family protein, partial [Corynebacteriales bacterium]|nr:aminopeptidase P family protein [Mycobacteriales bacterium]